MFSFNLPNPIKFVLLLMDGGNRGIQDHTVNKWLASILKPREPDSKTYALMSVYLISFPSHLGLVWNGIWRWNYQECVLHEIFNPLEVFQGL